MKWLIPTIIVTQLLVSGHASAVPPLVPDRGGVVVTEHCAGVTTEISMQWMHPHEEKNKQFYLVTEFNLKRNGQVIYTDEVRYEIVTQLNRWMKRYFAAISRINPQCDPDAGAVKVFIRIIEGEMNSDGAWVEVLYLIVDPSGVFAPGLYVARSVNGRDVLVPAASAEVPAARRPLLNK